MSLLHYAGLTAGAVFAALALGAFVRHAVRRELAARARRRRVHELPAFSVHWIPAPHGTSPDGPTFGLSVNTDDPADLVDGLIYLSQPKGGAR